MLRLTETNVPLFKFEYDASAPYSLAIVQFDDYLRSVVLPTLDPNTSDLLDVCIESIVPEGGYVPSLRAGNVYRLGVFKVVFAATTFITMVDEHRSFHVLKITFATEYSLAGLM